MKTLLPFSPNFIWDNPGARRKKVRIGRGPGSGKGKTSTRGHKGTYARSGGTIKIGYEGGQSPKHRMLPKRGFRRARKYAKELEKINLGKIAYYIEHGEIDAT